jgi:lysyl-tRNA synthetase class 1
MSVPTALRDAARVSKAWPYEEARKLLKRYPDGPGDKAIVFETGYGPSGLPHLGTFQEVARTLMVRHALAELVDWPSRLIAFSDDMDGMRKVPPGVPGQDMMHAHLDQPLSRVPDPYGCGHESYADHNNHMLRQFLDRFGFDYEFMASSDAYGSGRFDATLKAVLRHYDAIQAVMLPTLREERQGAPGSGRGGRCRGRADRVRGGGRADRPVDPLRRRQAAMEGRLGDALGRARRRL